METAREKSRKVVESLERERRIEVTVFQAIELLNELLEESRVGPYEMELPKIDPIFELLYALGISADEWASGVLDEINHKQAEESQADSDNENELGLTVEQRQLILATLRGRKKWGAIV